MQSSRLMELAETYGAHNYHPLPVVLVRGEGSEVWDVEGRRYLDFLSCYSAVSHGHRHPRIVAAMTEQAERLTLTSRAFHNDQLGPFLQELCGYAGAEMALPMNTGAEAVETALKAARKWAYRVKGVAPEQAEIIACTDNFHGRTITIISFSSEQLYRDDFGPFTPGFTVIPYGDATALEAAITPRTAAFLVEPIQGEAGVVIPPDGYLKAAREITRRHRVLLLADEVQTGLGRTGRPFCFQHEGIEPDLIIMGKALGGGVYPVSAVVGAREVLELFGPGEHGSTFGGNPLACAVARESLRVLVDECLAQRADELGGMLMERLRSLSSPYIREVRGKGLLVGLVLHPEAGGARRFCEALMSDGLLCKETREDVIRFAPPLVVSAEQLDWAAERAAAVLGRL
ncbi:MAG: ornithine--oxo-acid transaminase [Actinobacteria bacterium]|nr:ornithine--oxo-acid transaminase [Actinomycetota bacterium]